MEAMTGFFFARAMISRHMMSEARASPPGLSTLSTTALMFLFFSAARSWRMTSSVGQVHAMSASGNSQHIGQHISRHVLTI